LEQGSPHGVSEPVLIEGKSRCNSFDSPRIKTPSSEFHERVHQRRITTSVKGEIKEGAGFVKEEMNEHGKDPVSKKESQEGRDLRNEGRVEDGKAPKTTKPGTGHLEK
jgi:hypothetical protein